MLDYQAKWPLSLVVSRRAVTKYQLLFRHLFLAKFVERRLHTAWAEQQSTKVGTSTNERTCVYVQRERETGGMPLFCFSSK